MSWNSFDTGAYSGMIAETVDIPDKEGKPMRVYFSRPLGVESYLG